MRPVHPVLAHLVQLVATLVHLAAPTPVVATCLATLVVDKVAILQVSVVSMSLQPLGTQVQMEVHNPRHSLEGQDLLTRLIRRSTGREWLQLLERRRERRPYWMGGAAWDALGLSAMPLGSSSVWQGHATNSR